MLGAHLPLGEPIRLSRFSFQARQAERYRDGRILLAGDAAHLFPATGAALNAGLLDTVKLAWKLAAAIGGWAPAGLLDTFNRGARPTRPPPSTLATRQMSARLCACWPRLSADVVVIDSSFGRGKRGAVPRL